MRADNFFPPRPESKPTIYAYEDTNPQYAGLLKIGYTTVDAQTRVAQQYYPTLRPGKPPYPPAQNRALTTSHFPLVLPTVSGLRSTAFFSAPSLLLFILHPLQFVILNS
jgi:hypothetical protein